MKPDSRERRLNLAIAAATLALIPVGFVLVGTVFGALGDTEVPDCDDWTFDRAAWEATETADDEALALVRCGGLTGMTRAEVEELLGDRNAEGNTRWTYSAGAVNDYLGPGDGQALHVRFDHRGEVRSAGLRYGGNGRRAADDD